jgi:hypothetical protein
MYFCDPTTTAGIPAFGSMLVVDGVKPVNDDIGGLYEAGMSVRMHVGLPMADDGALRQVARIHERGVPHSQCAVTVAIPAARWTACAFQEQWVLGQPMFSIDPNADPEELDAIRRLGRKRQGDDDDGGGDAFSVMQASRLVSPPQLMAVLSEGSKFMAALADVYDSRSGPGRTLESVRRHAQAMAAAGGRMRIPAQPPAVSDMEKEKEKAQQQAAAEAAARPQPAPSLAPQLTPLNSAPPPQQPPKPAAAAGKKVDPRQGGTPAHAMLGALHRHAPTPLDAARAAPSGVELLRQQRQQRAAAAATQSPAASTSSSTSAAPSLPARRPRQADDPDASLRAASPAECLGVSRVRDDGSGDLFGEEPCRDDGDPEWQFFGITVRTVPETAWGEPKRWRRFAALQCGVARYANIVQLRRSVRFLGVFMRGVDPGNGGPVFAEVAVGGTVECPPYWGANLSPGDTVGFVLARTEAALDPRRPYIIKPWSSSERRAPTERELAFADTSGAQCVGIFFRVGIVVKTFDGDGDGDFMISDRRRKAGEGEGVRYPDDYGLLGRFKHLEGVRTDEAFEHTRRHRRVVVVHVLPKTVV